MSEAIGPVAVTDGRQGGPLLPGVSEVSEHTHQMVDEEVRRIVEEAERQTVALLESERHRLEALARALLERETLDQADAYEIAGVDLSAAETATEAPETASA
jgi:cell division protease FtsH